MASWIRSKVPVHLLLVSRGIGIVSYTVVPMCGVFNKAAISTDVQLKEHSKKPHLALTRPATGASETAKTRDRQENGLWTKESFPESLTIASCTRSHFLSSCGLPTHEDFKFEPGEFGSVVFTRTLEGIITKVELLQYSLIRSRCLLCFFVTIKSSDKTVGNKKYFMCRLNVLTIQENMSEEDIYDIFSLEVDDKIVFHYEAEPNEVIDAEKLKKKCFKYLKKHGITREFLYFLKSTFLPEYKEAYYDKQINQLADIIDDETV